MNSRAKTFLPAALAGAILLAAGPNALAAGIERLPGIVAVPAGYTTYYFSGALPTLVTPESNGRPADFGDTATQTRSVLDTLKARMDKVGVSYGDVVSAHVFMDSYADIPAMNKVWSEEFGTAAQPNRPARVSFKGVLVRQGALVEIEFIAAKPPAPVKYQ